MKFFISYKHTGEDLQYLERIIGSVCSGLEKANHDYFCTFWKTSFFNENNFSYRQIIDYSFDKLDECDHVLALVNSEEKSEGMLLEIGYALSRNKKLILAIREGIETSFQELSDKIIKFNDFEELSNKLKQVI